MYRIQDADERFQDHDNQLAKGSQAIPASIDQRRKETKKKLDKFAKKKESGKKREDELKENVIRKLIARKWNRKINCKKMESED